MLATVKREPTLSIGLVVIEGGIREGRNGEFYILSNMII